MLELIEVIVVGAVAATFFSDMLSRLAKAAQKRRAGARPHLAH